MEIFKKIERVIFPCQKKIDSVMNENQAAWTKLQEVVKEKKDIVTTQYPQFAHVAGRSHVNPR